MATSQDIFDAVNEYIERLNLEDPDTAKTAIATLDNVISLCQEHKQFIQEEHEDDEWDEEDSEDEDDKAREYGDRP